MNWLVSILEDIFQATFGFLKWAANGPWIFFTIVICFGLLYWMMWQKKYTAQAENDPNQLK